MCLLVGAAGAADASRTGLAAQVGVILGSSVPPPPLPPRKVLVFLGEITGSQNGPTYTLIASAGTSPDGGIGSPIPSFSFSLRLLPLLPDGSWEGQSER